MKHKIGLLLASIILTCVVPALAAVEITVFAAASLTDALKQIAVAYEQSSHDKIIFNFAASSTLSRQIESGAPADIFFSADEAQMDRLEKNDRILKETRKSRLSNSLVVVATVDSPLTIDSLTNLAGPEIKRIALADPKAVPAGVYSKVLLENLKLWTAVEPKFVVTENVRAALAAVESGNVEVGMVYKTDAAISKKVKIVYETPRAEGPRISYPMALVRESPQPEAARKFLRHLDSSDAARVFEKFGFLIQK